MASNLTLEMVLGLPRLHARVFQSRQMMETLRYVQLEATSVVCSFKKSLKVSLDLLHPSLSVGSYVIQHNHITESGLCIYKRLYYYLKESSRSSMQAFAHVA